MSMKKPPFAPDPNATSLDAVYEQAAALYVGGRPAEADRLAAAILARAPGDFRALFLRGAISAQGRRPADAAQFFRHAAAADPNHADAHANLGLMLTELGRWPEALAAFDAALALPGHSSLAETYCNRAYVHDLLGQAVAALADLDRALRSEPTLARAHSNRGSVLQGLGRHAEALAAYDEAIRLKPAYAEAHSKRGSVLLLLGRLDEALAACNRAIQLQPGLAAAKANRAAVLEAKRRALEEEALPEAERALKDTAEQHLRAGRWAEAGFVLDALLARLPDDYRALVRRGELAARAARRDEALAYLQRAAALQGADHEVHRALGALYLDCRDAESALPHFNRVIALCPHDAVAYSNRAVAYERLRRFEAALNDLAQALALDPRASQAHANQGAVLQALGRYPEALMAYERALSLAPDEPRTLSQRATALLRLQRLDEALLDSERALSLAPDLAVLHVNHGVVLRQLGRHPESRAALFRAAELEPANPVVQNGLGSAYAAEGDFEAALERYREALALDPGFAEAGMNVATTLLARGDFAAGWPLYEWRKRLPLPVGVRDFARPLWLGEEDLGDRSILVHAEQGLGDTLQFMRLALLLARRGARVALAVPKSLCPLLGPLASTTPGLTVLADNGPLPVTDFHCPLLSLPLALKLDPARDVGIEPPYLGADPARAARWRARLGAAGFKVGIAWHGHVKNLEIGRFFPVCAFASLADLPGVRLISLQKGDGEDQLAGLGDRIRIETLGPDFDGGDGAFMDSAAVMSNLDLVIAPDSALTHLAGALGRPTFLPLKFNPDWRWQHGRDDTPWYPRHRLFRQTRTGRWDDVFARLREALAARLS